eukprot:COSAG01_NODE_1573_length_9865_cov_132.568503_9_plen_235_part_00
MGGGQKRSASGGGGSDGAGGRGKRSKQWRPPGQAGLLSGGLRGVLVTCHTHRSREAQGEALALIRSAIADHTAATAAGAGGSGAGGGSTEDELEAELAALRAERKTLRPVDTGIKGCLFIALERHNPGGGGGPPTASEGSAGGGAAGARPSATAPPPPAPEALLAGLFAEFASGSRAIPRELIRLTPLAITVRGRLADAAVALPPLLEPLLGVCAARPGHAPRAVTPMRVWLAS